ncbi:hypothetical protein ElyMa_000802000 [Elysia marginata]|uniref:Uncharacterized protein n=1 Tax=Elysia marginata TaxID=1093978 RepID=A0AAV4GWN5_9GAST|nr:hypothetical protein ElyMa_000802000 [Elysia marginata]
MSRLGIEPATSRSKVRRANHSATLPPIIIIQCFYRKRFEVSSRLQDTPMDDDAPHCAQMSRFTAARTGYIRYRSIYRLFRVEQVIE